VRTLGIDLSANPAKTGACDVDWAAGTVVLLDRPTTDEQLVEAALSADMVAIDVPLGWPDGFVDALVAHRDGVGWPPITTDPPEDRLPLRYRTTDVMIRAGGAQPLSVSSDRIGVAAMRGARLQHLLGEANVPVDRSGQTGRVVEAYPAAALRAWGLTSFGYKGVPNRAVCGQLRTELASQCGWLAAAAALCLDGCDDDALDAFVCAIVARAALAGMTTRPPDEHAGVARREGWIHVPTASLSEVVRGSAARSDVEGGAEPINEGRA
jgi:predicted nuclease with RNAse H fold